ncbi:MAG: ester cyclase [Deltaproteobacteria bacterium]|nr:ester cyclase [Deltaproteobacteria bacterium]
MDHAQARALVSPFYEALNRPATRDVGALVRSAAAESWRSHAGPDASKSREEFIAQVIGFGRAIPDLGWHIEELLVDGDRIVVRSTATGTPAGELFGVPHGGRSFRITAIDIHTVAEGKLVRAWHVEDWASALKQLSGR